jgi:molybdopterin converting factor small subunit
MKVTLLAFATAARQFGWRSQECEAAAEDTPRALFQRFVAGFEPGVARVAVNHEYAAWDGPIGPDAREIAIIPPVSGG